MKQEFEQGLVPSQLFSLMAVHSLEVVACCSDYSSIHNSGCPGYYTTLGLDSDSDNCCSHTDPVVVAD